MYIICTHSHTPYTVHKVNLSNIIILQYFTSLLRKNTKLQIYFYINNAYFYKFVKVDVIDTSMGYGCESVKCQKLKY